METAKYYTSIVDLPLNKFIECLVDNNLFALVISGEPDKGKLVEIWDDIVQEYNDTMGDSEGKMYWKMFNKVTELFGNINIIKISIELLTYRYKKEDADDLNRLVDANFKFDISDPKKYGEELDRCEKRAKNSELLYKLKKEELKALEAKMTGEKREKPDKKYFADILLALMDISNGIRVNASEITTYEFCGRVRRYGEYKKEVERQNKKK